MKIERVPCHEVVYAIWNLTLKIIVRVFDYLYTPGQASAEVSRSKKHRLWEQNLTTQRDVDQPATSRTTNTTQQPTKNSKPTTDNKQQTDHLNHNTHTQSISSSVAIKMTSANM